MTNVLGFLFGVGLGFGTALFLVWNALPPAEVSSDPSALTTESKEVYILLVSMSYAHDGDLERAKARLALLREPEIRSVLARHAEQHIRELRPEAQTRSLAKMALVLGANSVALSVYAVSPTPTPIARATERAIRVSKPFAQTLLPIVIVNPAPTAEPATVASRVSFQLFEQVQLGCEQEKTPGARVLIYVQDANGQGLPGTKVRVQWNEGQDIFFTGLKNSDPGYADFDMQPGKSYSAMVMDGASQVAFGLDSDLLDPDCPADGKEHFRAWRVVFRRNH